MSTGVTGVFAMSATAAAGDWRHRKTSQSSNWVAATTRHPAR